MDVENDEEGKPLNIPDNINSPIEFFNLFVDDTFYQKMIDETNLYYQQTISKEEFTDNSRLNRWKTITKSAIQKYLGIIFWNGLLSNKKYEGRYFQFYLL